MRRAGFFLGVFIVSLIASTTGSTVHGATKSFEPDWLNAQPTYRELPNYQPDAECTKEKWTVEENYNYDYLEESKGPLEVCVYHGKDFAFAKYMRYYMAKGNHYLGVFTEWGWGVATGDSIGAKHLYKINNVSADQSYSPWTVVGPNSNAVLLRPSIASFGSDAYYVRSLPDNLIGKTGDGGYAYGYALKFPDSKIGETFFGQSAIYSVGKSLSGEWLVMITATSILLYNTVTNQPKLIEKLEWGSYYSALAWPGQTLFPTVTNDGKLIAFSGRNQPFRIIANMSACGVLNYSYERRGEPYSICPSIDLWDFTQKYSMPYSETSGGYRDYSHLAFSQDGSTLVYYDSVKWSMLTAGNMQYTPKMRYLALGDSFASGEGDITIGTSHYLPGTDEPGYYPLGMPREMCHSSDRAYPFLFAKDMGLGRGVDMQSMACSGAVRNDLLSSGKAPDYLEPGYLGQDTQLPWTSDGPRLRGIDNASQLQEQARATFAPGRVQQIEFVEKYHPQVATVMVSGNDLGFGDVVTGCIMNFPIGKACSYVDAGGRERMGAAIRTNYTEQVRFYQALKAASPYTEYYAIGYPQFISDKGLSCWDSGGLTQKERTFIRESVSYVNQSIRNAAATAGIRYVDIENALNGVQMCGGGQGVSGSMDRLASSILTEYAHHGQILSNNALPLYSRWAIAQFQDAVQKATIAGETIQNPAGMLMGYFQQLFHPNSVGHQAIRDYVAAHYGGSSLVDATCDGRVIICPSEGGASEPPIPEYFNPNNDVTVRDKIVRVAKLVRVVAGTVDNTSSITILKRNASISITAPGDMLDTPRSIMIYSDPIQLGELKNGESSVNVTIPSDFPVGFHTISLLGTNASGKSLEYVQYVFVEGAAGDVDGDGIADRLDPCLFAVPKGVDIDADGIDDGCDLSAEARISKESEVVSGGGKEINLLAISTSSIDNIGDALTRSFSEPRDISNAIRSHEHAIPVHETDLSTSSGIDRTVSANNGEPVFPILLVSIATLTIGAVATGVVLFFRYARKS